MTTNCTIGKVKLKNGLEVIPFPQSKNNYSRIDLGWGEVVFRAYDGKRLKVSDINYMCDAAKHINMDDS